MGYVGNEPSVNFTSFAKQDITGDGGASYTLTHAVANANEIEVFVNNVRQEPTSAYTVSGTALTMTGNVASTDDFYVIYLGKALQTTTPPNGSVSTAKIADDAVTSAKLDTNIAISGTLDVSGGFTSQGIDDNATSTKLTITSTGTTTTGTASITADGTNGIALRRNTNVGLGVSMNNAGTDIGGLYHATGNGLGIAGKNDNSGGLIFGNGANPLYPAKVTSGAIAVVDDYVDLGSPSLRFEDLYATTGSIQTSDQQEKIQ